MSSLQLVQSCPPGEIRGEISATVFELLHMEIVSHFKSRGIEGKSLDGDVSTQAAATSLDALGFRVGQSVCESLMKEEIRYMRDDKESVPGKVMKFIARTMWPRLFNSSFYPSLKTNKQRDMWVVDDPDFKLLHNISAGQQYKEHTQLYLAFTCGLLRGALANIGIASKVHVEVDQLPSCLFQIKIE
jgi:hypothetical protein